MKLSAVWLSYVPVVVTVSVGAIGCKKEPANEAQRAAPPAALNQPAAPESHKISVPGAAAVPSPPSPEVSAVEPAPIPGRVEGPTALPQPQPQPQPQPAAATVADPTFSIRLVPPSPSGVGATATAHVTVMPGKGFKINKEFPASLQMEATPGVTFPSAKLERGAAKVDTEHELTFAVGMTGQTAGDYAIKGLLKFAVCDDANCIPKKQAIALDLRVK